MFCDKKVIGCVYHCIKYVDLSTFMTKQRILLLERSSYLSYDKVLLLITVNNSTLICNSTDSMAVHTIYNVCNINTVLNIFLNFVFPCPFIIKIFFGMTIIMNCCEGKSFCCLFLCCNWTIFWNNMFTMCL